MTVIDPSLDKGRELSVGFQSGEAVASRAMLAHDMRGALQGIMGGIALIDPSGFDDDLGVQLARVFAAAETVSRLLNLFLDEVPDPVGGTDQRTVEIPSFLDHLRRRWTGEALGKGRAFRIDADPNVAMFLAVDPVMLARVAGNLIGNAVAHAGSGAIQLVVERSPDGAVVFRLRDEGPGVDPATLEKVTRHTHGPSGTGVPARGLGLHIARALVDEMGAEITLANRASGGFEAALRFPPELCLETEAATGLSTRPPMSPHDLSGVRILLAEDNPTNQMVATQMLKALKARVTVASDGVEALEQFETGGFDLVVVDIEMPRMSGLDVIRAIRSRLDPRAGVPIVALTAYALREHQDRIAEAGANGLISKPISSIEALGRALGAHVASAREQSTRPTPPAPESDPGVVVDLAVYEALRQAIGPDMMAELMEKVVADLVSARADLAGAISPIEREAIRSASHILISVAGAVGATRLQACARELNIAAYSENIDGIGDQVRNCLGELDAVILFSRGQRAAG